MSRITYSGFINNFLEHLSNIFNFSGTESRQPYIMNLIAYWLASGLLTWVLPFTISGWLYILVSIAVTLMTWSSLVRRLRDTGLGTLGILLFAILYLIPYLGIITLIYAVFVDSKKSLL